MVPCFLLLAGCAAKRDSYNVPALDLPKQYAKAPIAVDIVNSKNTSIHSPANSFPLNAALAEWWRLFGSQELNGLMDRALANNPDLRIAVLRIAQSKARLDQAGADKVPTITMPVQVKNEYPESGIGRGNANGNNKSRITHQISLRGDWRPDIWGESYSLYESAELQLLRATYQRDDMQRNVVANVVTSYMEYLSLNDRLRVAHETEKSLSEMLASVNARLEAGDATITEMEQQKAAVYSAKASIPVLEQQREVVLNRLASLAGSAPVALKLSDNGLDSAKFPPVLPGVPSALLLRRPDVRAAEARLLAADADIDVARARVLPPLDLTAQIGYGSVHMSKLFMPQSLFWSTIANLSVTIFDSGKRASEVEFTQAVHEELVETYVRVIYDAVREVDDSLSAISLMGKRLEAQGVAADSSLRAWNFSQEAFMAGAVDYLVVLDTQRTYQRNLDDWYNVRMERYRGLVNLFNALGGGVTGGDTLPGNGARPAPLAREQDYGVALAEAGAMPVDGNDAVQNRASDVSSIDDMVAVSQHGKGAGRLVERVDWAGSLLWRGAWLVELSGVYDRSAVLPAWRDLNVRFFKRFEGMILLPQRQGQVSVAGKERASWYRLFVATFSSKKTAEEFCAALRAGQQRCSVVSPQSLTGKGDFVAPLEQQGSVAAGIGAAARMADAASPGKNEHPDMAQGKDEQQPQVQAEQPVVAQNAPQAGQTTETEAKQHGQDAVTATEAGTTQASVAQEAEVPAKKQAVPEAAQPAATEAVQIPDKSPETPASSPETLVERWMRDWAEKNIEGYLSRYDIGFRPENGKDREAWETKRRSRIGEANSIRVHAENLKVQQQGELVATARFVEILEVGSYKKTSWKKLSLIRRDRDGEWKIREEKEVTKAEIEAHAAAEAKAAKLQAKRETDAEAARMKAERQAQIKAEKQAAVEEKARLEEESKAAKVKAREEAQAEAARVAAEKKAKAETDAQAAAEAKAAKLKARREAEAEKIRLKAELSAQAKAEKLAAKIARQEAKAEAVRAKAEQKANAALVATQQNKERFDGMDWSDQQFWLVEMTDMYDRNAVPAAWRDLRTHFSEQMQNRTIHPRCQDGMGDAGEDHALRYQLFIARFSEKQLAEEFCAMLRAGQRRCGVVSSQSFAEKAAYMARY